MTNEVAPPPATAHESWQSYRYLADNAIDVVLEVDLSTRVRWTSPSVEDVLGWRPEELVGRSTTDITHPDDTPEIGELVMALGGQGTRVRSPRVRMLSKDGGWKGLQLRARPVLDPAGLVAGHIITLRDTTDRDDALRALAVLTEGNRVLARANDEDDLLSQMCEAILGAGGYPLAYYGARVDDESRTVRTRASAGPRHDYADRIQISWGDGPLGQGPTGIAIRTGTTQVRNSLAHNPQFAPWREAAEAESLGSSISLPVRSRGEIDGALVVCATEPYAFDHQAQELLETLAADLGLGLDRLRGLRELELATVQVEEQNARLQGVFDSQFDPFVLLETVRDPSGAAVDLRYAAVSDAALAHHGLAREQMIGRSLTELLPGLVSDGARSAYRAVAETGEPVVLDDFEYVDDRTGIGHRFDIRAVKAGDGVAVTFRDVTARHAASVALAQSEERYRILAEHATDVVWQSEPGAGVLWSSESVTPVLGWDPQEAVDKGFDLVHPDDAQAVMLNLASLGRGLAAEGEARVACKDGTWKWVGYKASRVAIGHRVLDIASLHDIDEEVRARNALAFALGHDPLTGMAARPAMLHRIAETLGSLRGHRLAAVLCVGVDRLAAVNEAYTHAAGDLVLTALATRIAEATGTPDLIGRGTGTEFLVVLPDLVSGDEAASLAELLLSEARAPVVFGSIVIEPTVSIGIAIGDRTSDREELARNASAAMGQAKADGRNQYVFADASMADRARHRLDVERRIRDGLDEGRFLPHFQPVVDLGTGSLTGYEALVRYQRADGTIAPPARFMPIAELSPLICDIDLMVLRRCLEAMASLPDQLSVAVNLSTVTLTRPGYPQLVEQLIRESGIRPSRLHLEVTETALLGEIAQVVEVMDRTAALGARWYVDDFGTGYSSISHLRDLPVSGLKLDVTFSAGIRDGDQKCIRLAQALAGLANGLGLDTIAEGVETEAEAEVLRAQGWSQAQGWLFGHPAPLP